MAVNPFFKLGLRICGASCRQVGASRHVQRQLRCGGGDVRMLWMIPLIVRTGVEWLLRM